MQIRTHKPINVLNLIVRCCKTVMPASSIMIVYYIIPKGICGHLNDNGFDAGPAVSHDFDVAEKIMGFLNHSSAKFSFIGPDRKPVTISTIPQCLDIARIIKDTGLLNYKQARIPVSSGLNLQA